MLELCVVVPGSRRCFRPGEVTGKPAVFAPFLTYGYWSKPWHLVNPKIAGKWMFIPLELIIIGFDPPPYRRFRRK